MARTRPAIGSTLTVGDYQALPEEPRYRIELVRGHLVREPRPAPLHARVLSRLVHALEDHVRTTGDGVVLTDAGFLLREDPDTVRVPDVSWVSGSRVPEDAYGGGFWRLAPDLAVEVLSPSNSASEIQEKVLDYFAAGARLVWIVDPRLQAVAVHDSATSARLLGSGEALAGGEVLPGLHLPLGALFAL